MFECHARRKGKRRDVIHVGNGKRKHLKIAVTAIICVLIAAGVGLAVWQPWAVDGQVENTIADGGGSADAGDGNPEGEGDSDSYGGEVTDDGSGKGSDGDTIDRDDYDSDEDYLEALSESLAPEADVPKEHGEEDGIEYRKGTITVYFERSTSEERAREIVEETGGTWVDSSVALNTAGGSYDTTVYYEDLADAGLDELQAMCQELETYEGVSGAVVFRTDGTKANSASVSDEQHYLEAGRFSDAWESQRCEGAVEIAVFDAGFQCSHEDLSENIGPYFDASSGECEVEDTEDDGHGTAVAGVACAEVANGLGIDGASYNATLVPIRIMDDSGDRPWSYVIRGLQYLCAVMIIDGEKPTVVNMSFEALDLCEEVKEETQFYIDILHDAGVVFVAAAGNWDSNDPDDSLTAEKYPAAFDNVIGVGAIDANDEVADFSNQNSCVDICAPGVDVYTTLNEEAEGEGYGDKDGTSFSAPQVAAAAALVQAAYPSIAADQVEAKLEDTARDLGEEGRDDSYGYGALDAAAALGVSDDDDLWDAPSSSVSADGYLTTYAVLDGTVASEFIGLTNVNFDFGSGDMLLEGQADCSDIDFSGVGAAGFAMFATSLNDNPNPYYSNLFYDSVLGSSSEQATTWMCCPDSGSWGDSSGVACFSAVTGEETINGLEYEPDIVFGANKLVNWNLRGDGSNSSSYMYWASSSDDSYNPLFVNNDATNLWTHMYTSENLAIAADELTASTGLSTRYGDYAVESAVSLERATRGQMLYIASLIDSGAIEEKEVAYLYAIDSDGTGYFLVPTAEGLLEGDDTGASEWSSEEDADDCYASDNAALSFGYEAALPFVTETFDSGAEFEGGIVSRVQDVCKTSPACVVTSSDDRALADVDVIIYNSTVETSLSGTSSGENVSGVDNDYLGDALNDNEVAAWAEALGYAGDQIIAGSDFGVSSDEGIGSVSSSDAGKAPLLVNMRDFSADKATWAAWAFAAVYPETYGGNDDATYCYWMDEVYHVDADCVPEMVSYMTNQTDAVVYDTGVSAFVEDAAATGFEWWASVGSEDDEWSGYAYYNGSSRASFYSGDDEAEEPEDAIGIFAPSSSWVAEMED